MLRQTPPTVVAEIDRLLENNTDGEIAQMLNRQGLTSGTGKPFHLAIVARIRTGHSLQSRYDRLRTRGMLTLDEIAKCRNVTPDTIKIWRRAGLLVAHRYNDNGQYLFEPPGADGPTKFRQQGKTRGRFAASRQM
jgi:hypothetical protein